MRVGNARLNQLESGDTCHLLGADRAVRSNISVSSTHVLSDGIESKYRGRSHKESRSWSLELQLSLSCIPEARSGSVYAHWPYFSAALDTCILHPA